MSTLSRIKSIAKSVNEGLMETYVPRSQAEMDFYNTHTIVKYKNLVPGSTDDDKIFNASNIEKGVGHRSKDNTDSTDDKPATNDKSSKTKALSPAPIQNDD